MASRLWILEQLPKPKGRPLSHLCNDPWIPTTLLDCLCLFPHHHQALSSLPFLPQFGAQQQNGGFYHSFGCGILGSEEYPLLELWQRIKYPLWVRITTDNNSANAQRTFNLDKICCFVEWSQEKGGWNTATEMETEYFWERFLMQRYLCASLKHSSQFLGGNNVSCCPNTGPWPEWLDEEIIDDFSLCSNFDIAPHAVGIDIFH